MSLEVDTSVWIPLAEHSKRMAEARKVTDEMVERAAVASFNHTTSTHGTGLFKFSDLPVAMQHRLKARMRAALRAALNPKESA